MSKSDTHIADSFLMLKWSSKIDKPLVSTFLPTFNHRSAISVSLTFKIFSGVAISVVRLECWVSFMLVRPQHISVYHCLPLSYLSTLSGIRVMNSFRKKESLMSILINSMTRLTSSWQQIDSCWREQLRNWERKRSRTHRPILRHSFNIIC